ncbi:MAG: PTS sugar transporter subunit IIA [Lactobacillus sp.]|uniref:PTS sugar transporter subunit IIA n=1 Tax=Bombilactobacillus bombi TaxID=1303590 RepID=UPI0035E9CBEF|nr:PTS sugar transporter subunit IIA [Lactobacillus sp.]MCO6543370.1 PTS sugar transporter subunit IIA [Lactobacillus sp.]
MTQLVLISHGKFCEGIKDSIEMIMGPQNNLFAVGLYEGEDPEHYKKRLLNVVNKFNKFVIFADLVGGTPYNVAYRLLLSHKYNFELYTGMNLPMIIGFENSQITKDAINIVNTAKEGIQQIKPELRYESDDQF